MKTLKTKEQIEQWLQECMNEENELQGKMANLISNADYFSWLIRFTQERKFFTSDDWLYSHDQISEHDREKVDQLYLFYESVAQHAERNHIYPSPCSYGSFYKVRWNKIGFGIGISVGQGTAFFCCRIPVENNSEFIDFNDLMTHRKQGYVDQMNHQLESLSMLILKMYESGIPMEAIKNTLKNTIQEINHRQENKLEILRKN